MAEQRDMSGILFNNGAQDGNKPQFTGSITIEGREWRLAGWPKTSQKGTKFLSLAASEPRERPTRETSADDDEQIPF